MHMLIYRLMEDNDSRVFMFGSEAFAYKFLLHLQSVPIWWSLWRIGEELDKTGQHEQIYVDGIGV